MNGYLLDTNVALLAVSRSVALSAAVRGAMERGTNYLSVIVYWEVMLKTMKGTLKVGDPRSWWLDAIEQLAARPLAFVTAVHALPPIHKDPFDRVLIAQATVEDLTLLTTDGEIPQYASERFQVVS